MTEPAIRKMRDTEAAALAALEKECFPDPWSEKSLEDMQKSPHTLYLVAETEGEIVGYCGAQIVLDEGEILRIAVKESWRKQKIGTALLEQTFACTPEVTMWNLEVREHSTPAIGLYRKMGFEDIGRRKGYYSDPREDAILMQRII